MKKQFLAALFLFSLLILSETKLFAQTEEKKVYSFITMENPPVYPGGISAFYQLLSNNVKYPKDAIKNNIQGTVKVSFTVEKDGSLSDVTADNVVGYGLDEEAVRVIKLSKKWDPGLVEGKAVRVRYNIPIKFSYK